MRAASHAARSVRERSTPPRSPAGFTLIELMIALTVGGLAISSFYGVAKTVNGFSQEQHRLGNLQDQLRRAMGQLKRDVQRAGYLATPNMALPTEGCGNPPMQLTGGNTFNFAGFMRYDANFNSAAAGIDPAGIYGGNGDVGADRVWLLGNFETSTPYGGVLMDPGNRSVVRLPTRAFYAQRRDFGNWQVGLPDQLDQASFDNIFPVGRPLAVESRDRKHRHFALLNAVSTAGYGVGAPISFTLSQPVPNNCDVTTGSIAPLQAIEYRVLSTAAAIEEGATAAAAAARDGALVMDPSETLPQLHRREVDVAASATRNGLEDRVVLDYVVSFRMSFLSNRNAAAEQLDDIDWNFAVGAAAEALVNNTPERIRAVRIFLAARSSGQDRSFSAAIGNPLLAFQIDPGRPGAARVRALSADIFVPNIALETY